MDQKKTGSFLKTLRKEKGLTQEQAAEKLNISARTVSRWETGAYMPDISMLVAIAELYDADVREIIDGERKDDMNSEVREVAEKMADYSVSEKKFVLRWVRRASFVMTLLTVLTSAMFIITVVDVHSYVNDPVFGPFYNIFLLLTLAFPLSLTVLSSMITLYVNGKLGKAEDNRTVYNMINIITVLAIILAVIGFIVMILGSHVPVPGATLRK